MTAECLEECDDLILWFSEGKYVYKAMELKMRYKPLTPLQQEKYDRRLEEAEKSSEREAEKLIDLSRIKAEEEEKAEKRAGRSCPLYRGYAGAFRADRRVGEC